MNFSNRSFASTQSLNEAVTGRLKEVAAAAIARSGRFCLALSGGSTPLELFRALQAEPELLPWEKVFIFWADERLVAADCEESNYGNATRLWLSRISIPAENIFGVDTAVVDPAGDYEARLKIFFGGRLPEIDLTLLGVGFDGHTASLFPGGRELKERDNWVVEVEPPGYIRPAVRRVSLTFPVLNNSKNIIFITGLDKKKEVVEYILHNRESIKYPAQRVAAREDLRWYIDDCR